MNENIELRTLNKFKDTILHMYIHLYIHTKIFVKSALPSCPNNRRRQFP